MVSTGSAAWSVVARVAARPATDRTEVLASLERRLALATGDVRQPWPAERARDRTSVGVLPQPAASAGRGVLGRPLGLDLEASLLELAQFRGIG